MTSLEIKRLDSQAQPTNSTVGTYKSNNMQAYKHDKSNEHYNQDLIPISIVKSPSYNAITSTNVNEKHSQSKLVNEHQQQPKFENNSSSPVKSPSGLLTNGSITKHPSPMLVNAPLTLKKSPQTSNHTLLSNNDDVDSVLNANNNASLLSNVENTGTLTFNKYGFLQANETSSSSKTNTINRNSTLTKNKKRADGENINEENKRASASNQNDDSFNNSDTEANRAVTNLKDYIQNTDVEEFAEHLPIEVIRWRNDSRKSNRDVAREYRSQCVVPLGCI